MKAGGKEWLPDQQRYFNHTRINFLQPKTCIWVVKARKGGKKGVPFLGRTHFWVEKNCAKARDISFRPRKNLGLLKQEPGKGGAISGKGSFRGRKTLCEGERHSFSTQKKKHFFSTQGVSPGCQNTCAHGRTCFLQPKCLLPSSLPPLSPNLVRIMEK